MSDPQGATISSNRDTVSKVLSLKVILGAVLTVVVFFVLVNLGLWQLSRGEEKQLLEQELQRRQNMTPLTLGTALERYPIDDMTGLRVKVSLSPSDNMTFLFDNQTYQGKVGYLAYQLMREQQGHWVLVERGFVPAPSERSQLPEVNWVASPQELVGRFYQKSLNPLSSELSIEPQLPHRIQNLNVQQLSQWLGEPILPVVFQPQEENWPYPQPWIPFPLSAEKHFGYAVQWFAMATVLLFIALIISVKLFKARRLG